MYFVAENEDKMKRFRCQIAKLRRFFFGHQKLFKNVIEWLNKETPDLELYLEYKDTR